MSADSWLTRARAADKLFLRPLVLPERFKGATFSGIAHPGVHDLAVSYGERFLELGGQGIAPAICGTGGQYKTYAAAALTRLVHQQALVDCEFVSCASELPALERMRYNASTSARIAELCAVPWLVLDDFAVVRESSWIADFMVEIAERRYAGLRPTMYTGNITFTAKESGDLARRYGACFARRVLVGSEGWRLMLT